MSRLTKSLQPGRRTAERTLPPQVGERVRKPYRAPRLKVYGRLAELTRFGGSLFTDSGGGLGAQP